MCDFNPIELVWTSNGIKGNNLFKKIIQQCHHVMN